MTDTTLPQAKLFAALAALQAELPRVGKDANAKIPGKDGKQGYAYKYADLADISQAILPLLGKHGLAFTAKPTMMDGEFVLAYKLVHSSGESDEGIYLLPSPKTTPPQQVGSAITYARRYSLCCVTGTAPDGDDDDATAAQNGHQQSAADAFEKAGPARPQPTANGNGQRGQVSRPAQPQAATPDPAEVDEAAQEYANQAHEARTLADLEKIYKDAREAGKVTAIIRSPSTGNTGKLAVYIDWKRKTIAEADAALTELTDAASTRKMDAAALEAHLQQITGADLESATVAQLREATKALALASAA